MISSYINNLFLFIIRIYCPSYTTHCCKVRIIQLTPKLHVSTPRSHLQAYNVCVLQGTFVNASEDSVQIPG